MATAITDYGYLQTVWDDLYAFIGNPYGVAGLMGNFYKESWVVPWCKQGDNPPSAVSQNYTTRVDNGSVSEYDFVHSGSGYGLAQWTSSGRKQGLYDLFKTGYSSIGDVHLQTAFVIEELSNSFASVLTVLQNATDIYTPTAYVLHNYEMPYDQSITAEQERADCASQIYNICYNSTNNYVSVIGGSGSGYYNQGDTVTITAYPTSYQFKEWVIISGNATITNPTASTTTFIKTDQNITVKATYVGQPVPPPVTTKRGMPVWMMVRPIR